MSKLHLTLIAAAVAATLACTNAPSAPSEVPLADYGTIDALSTPTQAPATPATPARMPAGTYENVRETPGTPRAAAMNYQACQYRGEQHSGDWDWYTIAGNKKGFTKERGVRMWNLPGWACGHTGTKLPNDTYCGGWGNTHEWVYMTNPCG